MRAPFDAHPYLTALRPALPQVAIAEPGPDPQAGPGDIVDVILHHAWARPDALALKDDSGLLTYQQLAEQVIATAAGLAGLGVGPGDRVAIILSNSTKFVIAALGCLWLGAVFVPMTPDDPPARRDRLLESARPTLLVADQRGGPKGPPQSGGGWPCADAAGLLIEGRTRRPGRTRDPRRDAYMIYTSGTTGAPKGIRTPECAFRAAVTSAALALGLGPTARTLCVSPFHFDGAYGTAFSTLVAGGAVFIPPRDELRYGKRFYRTVLEERITHTGFTPSYLRLLLASPKMASLRDSQLRTLGLGGEQCIAADLQRLWVMLPDLRIFNRYGPTEATIEVTTHEIAKDDLGMERLPIGTPHPGVSFHLVREDGSLVVGDNEHGELLIGGVQLMRGYWEDEPLTATVLRHDPALGEVVLRTGDLAYRDNRGRYFFLGRRDSMVKHRGVRVSLDEITRVLRSIDPVIDAACITMNEREEPRIAAFVVAGPDVSPSTLLDSAGRELPTTMLPDDVFIVDSLPMTTSGKVDHHQLPGLIPREPPTSSN